MKVYRFGLEKAICYDIVIIGDDGEIRVAFIGTNSVMEYIAKERKFNDNVVRLEFGGGSSMPYKDSDGNLCKKYTLIYDSNR